MILQSAMHMPQEVYSVPKQNRQAAFASLVLHRFGSILLLNCPTSMKATVQLKTLVTVWDQKNCSQESRRQSSIFSRIITNINAYNCTHMPLVQVTAMSL